MAAIEIDSIKDVKRAKLIFEGLDPDDPNRILVFERRIFLCQEVEEIQETFEDVERFFFNHYLKGQAYIDMKRKVLDKWLSICNTLAKAANFCQFIFSYHASKHFYPGMGKLAVEKVEFFLNQYKEDLK